jgi:hypothetical protein
MLTLEVRETWFEVRMFPQVFVDVYADITFSVGVCILQRIMHIFFYVPTKKFLYK